MRLALKIFVARSLVIRVVAGVAGWSIAEVANLVTADRDITTRTTGARRRGAMRRLAPLAAGLALAGCAATATAPPPPPDPLRRADQEMGAAHYREAAQLYEEFVRANPQHAAAERARAAHTALGALIAAQGERDRLRADLAARDVEIARLRQDLGARATESAGRTAEVTRLRRDLDARQAEVDRLKGDLDRLRSIDLRREPSRR